MFDYHIHSKLSFDGIDTIESIARAALASGLDEICFCEHIDPEHTYRIPWNGFIDFDNYRADIERAREKFPDLVIRTGLEAGLTQSALQSVEQYLAYKPLDFVIASQHLINGIDPYYPEYFQGKTKREAEETYLQCLLQCIRNFEPYSVVGHIGYVSKKAPYKSSLNYEDYPELIDEILKTAIHSGHGIEINTSTYAVLGEPMPSPGIIRRFLELGGEIITIGSDTHGKKRTGDHSADALALLKSLGARYVCTFAGMKPIFHKI